MCAFVLCNQVHVRCHACCFRDAVPSAQVCPVGEVITAVTANYGAPSGVVAAPNCNSWYPNYACSATASEAVFQVKCLQRSACAVLMTPSTFGLDNSFCAGLTR